MIEMDYVKITEGSCEIEVPRSDIPEHGRAFGFYNPEMRTDRNISVSVLSVFRDIFIEKFDREPEICDALCATGIRGIRYGKEVGGKVLINDINENAIRLAQRNALLNNADVEATEKDANVLLSERRFDVIDIDPFGSPYPFIDSAARSIRNFGLLCITATDTATLFGIYPEVSERRYGIRSMKCSFSQELGARILATFVMRELSKYNKAFVPVIIYQKRHYVRLTGMVEKNFEKTEKILKEFDFLHCSENEWKKGLCKCAEKDEGFNLIGNLYLGKLKEKDFCIKALENLDKRGLEGAVILRTIINEPDTEFYYEPTEFYKNGLSMKINDIIFELAKRGFVAGRTIFSETGIKTNAKSEDIKNILK